MPLPAILLPVLSKLAESGLGLIAGAIESKGKEVVEKTLGVKIPATPSELTPEVIKELKIAEMKHEEFLLSARIEEKKLDIETHRIEVQDRSDARGRDKAFIQAGRKNTRGDVLAYLAVGALVLDSLILMLGINVPETNEKLLYLLLGALIVIVKDVYGFEFGSSKDASRHANTLTDMVKKHESGS